MAELRESHLRYLLAIYELSRNDPDVGIQAVAGAVWKNIFDGYQLSAGKGSAPVC